MIKVKIQWNFHFTTSKFCPPKYVCMYVFLIENSVLYCLCHSSNTFSSTGTQRRDGPDCYVPSCFSRDPLLHLPLQADSHSYGSWTPTGSSGPVCAFSHNSSLPPSCTHLFKEHSLFLPFAKHNQINQKEKKKNFRQRLHNLKPVLQ